MGTEGDCYANVSLVETTESFIDDQIQLQVEQPTCQIYHDYVQFFYKLKPEPTAYPPLSPHVSVEGGSVFWVSWLQLL